MNSTLQESPLDQIVFRAHWKGGDQGDLDFLEKNSHGEDMEYQSDLLHVFCWEYRGKSFKSKLLGLYGGKQYLDIPVQGSLRI